MFLLGTDYTQTTKNSQDYEPYYLFIPIFSS